MRICKLACTFLLMLACGDQGPDSIAMSGVDPSLPPFDPSSICVELTEGELSRAWTAKTPEQGRYASVYSSTQSFFGQRATRLYTNSGLAVTMRIELPGGEWDTTAFESLWLAVRGSNQNAGGWQNRAPEIALVDARGRKRQYRASAPIASVDGRTWSTHAIPLAGGNGWSVIGSTADASRIVAVELTADTYGVGFRLDVDALFFAKADGTCDAAPLIRPRCDEITEGYASRLWSTTTLDGARTSVSTLGRSAAIDGWQAVRLTTESGSPVALRRTLERPVDASDRDLLLLSVRAFNGNTPSWQNAAPELALEDASGSRAIYRSTTGPLAPVNGLDWRELRVPLSGGGGWSKIGSADLSRISAIELRADTWGAGFSLDVDRMYFSKSDPLCGRTPGGYDYWPNPRSKANSDPWLVEHQGELRFLEPKVLVLNFVNPSDPTAIDRLIGDVMAGYREASRPRGYENASVEPQLRYRLARPIVDLRDGSNGRLPAPAGWSFENSSLMPRRDPSEPGAWRFDYAELFSATFAAHYGFVDPARPSLYKNLCRLVDDGEVHEVWILVSGETPADPVTMAEATEWKQRYDAYDNKIAGAFDGCGNGCLDPDVPRCGRSLRFVGINYRRGPGCGLHSLGHLIESQAPRGVLPGAQDWFTEFARFDLDVTDGLPFPTLYARECTGAPPERDWGPGCIEHPTPSSARFHYGQIYERASWDPSCGSVHFPPNARSHYDFLNPQPVITTCTGFGRGGSPDLVSADRWQQYEASYPDCGGGFLVWWYQNMPGFASGHVHGDGRPMRSIWPALFF